MAKKFSKKESQALHFKRRSIQRVGVELNPRELVKLIQKQKLEFIERQSNRVTVYRYEHNEEQYRVFYDKNRHQVITITPEEFHTGEQDSLYRSLLKKDRVIAIQRVQQQLGCRWEEACSYIENIENQC